MPSPVGYPTVSKRGITLKEVEHLRNICDTHKFAYGTFCAIIVSSVLADEELTKKCIRKTQEFEDDQRPATIAEMKTLREQLRQQEEELAQLREFKAMQQAVLNGTR